LALAKLDQQDSIPAILPLLRDDSEELRAFSAVALGQLSALDAADEIQQLLKDPVPQVRSFAIEGLAELGHQEALTDIEPLLKDRDWRVRASAIYGVQRLQGKSPSIRLQLGKLRSDAHEEVRKAAENVFKTLPSGKDPQLPQKEGIR
jgi:HEAT repeat protein